MSAARHSRLLLCRTKLDQLGGDCFQGLTRAVGYATIERHVLPAGTRTSARGVFKTTPYIGSFELIHLERFASLAADPADPSGPCVLRRL